MPERLQRSCVKIYGSGMKVFQTEIPHSVRAAEASAEGKSIFAHDPKGKVAAAYEQFTREVLAVEMQRAKNAVGLASDPFSTQASRDDAQREKVQEIPLEELHPFAHHPFKVLDDDRMKDTADSIREIRRCRYPP